MDNTVNIGMFREHIVESFLVPNVKTNIVRSFAADKFYAIDDLLRRIVEIVYDNDFVASVEEGEGGKGANVASTPARKSLAAEPFAIRYALTR